MGLAYPALNDHPQIADFEASEYLFGEDLLVAPITQPGGQRQVLVPPGEWLDWWTQTPVGLPGAATVVDVSLPVTQTPLYLRAGAILPLLRPTIDTLAPATDPAVDSFDGKPGRLYLLVAPASANGTTRTLYDGTALGWAWTPTNSIGVELTSKAGQEFTTDAEWTLVVGMLGKPTLVTVQQNGASVPMQEVTDDAAWQTCATCWRAPDGAGHVLVRAPLGATVTVKL